MAQLGSLIVTGDSRFLNTINGSITGTASNVTGTVAVNHGGTGATTAANARTALGIGNVGTLTYGSDTTKFLRNDGTWQVVNTDIPIATTSTAGKVKPDGTSIGITTDGTISGVELISDQGLKIKTTTTMRGMNNAPIRILLSKGSNGNNITTKTWNGLTRFNGEQVWTDGTNIYYSEGSSKQYILDKSTSTWSAKSWNFSYEMFGSRIWTDGTDTYFSYGSYQKKLDKGSWVDKAWHGYTNFQGSYVWTDGTNIYFSNGGYQKILDKSTSTWISMPWSGLTSFDARYTWTDGDNIYYSKNTTHYVLNKSTFTWSTKTWTGLTNFGGNRVWTDGYNIYFSNTNTNEGSVGHYVLNKSTSTWSAKTWTGSTDFDAWNIWTDGINIYYSSGYEQYVISTKKYYNIDTSDIDIKNNLTFGSSTTTYLRNDGTWATPTNTVMKKTRYTITATSWSNSADANGYYTYTVTLSPTLNTSYPPNVYIAGANDSTFPTDTEKEQYALLEQCNHTATNSLTLYATTKPESNFYVYIEGLGT